MVRNLNVTEKIKCQKIDKYFLEILRDELKNIYNFVEERDVKQKVLTILKTLNQNIGLNIKKKTWLMLKEDIDCV